MLGKYINMVALCWHVICETFLGCESDYTIKQKEINGQDDEKLDTNNDKKGSGINSTQQENLEQSSEGKENVNQFYWSDKKAIKTYKVDNFRASTSD